MSWLLAAAIPPLLMLAAIGLERVETGLNRAAVAAAEVTAFLEHAEAKAAQVATRANPRFRPTQQANRV